VGGAVAGPGLSGTLLSPVSCTQPERRIHPTRTAAIRARVFITERDCMRVYINLGMVEHAINRTLDNMFLQYGREPDPARYIRSH
jgi:hypothetical protein